MEPHDRLTPDNPATASRRQKDSERRCILTGETAPRAGLIRLALGPDGAVAADWSERLPGRGAWISADSALFAGVAAKGRLRGALARAFKTSAFHLPDDLEQRITAGLEARLLARLGLEKRAGTLILGGDRVREALARGKVLAVLHAADARPDGADRLDGMARAVGESLGETITHHRLPIGREALSAALGRDNVVHMGVTDAAAAARVLADVARLAGFCPAQTTVESTNDGTDSATAIALTAGERH
ncbi:MAG: DUF448 domain-containing protein [Alphaproteobacteria bacterium]|nr:DUF448 domain-containing protein [Alphaproteobacteria bacterium]